MAWVPSGRRRRLGPGRAGRSCRPPASPRRCGGRPGRSRGSPTAARAGAGLTIGTAASTRSERFRCIQSRRPDQERPRRAGRPSRRRSGRCGSARGSGRRSSGCGCSRSARDAGSEAAEAADDQVDRHAGLRGARQQHAHLAVLELVHLAHDPRRPAGRVVLDLALDQLDELASACASARPPASANAGVRERPVRKWKSVTTSLGDRAGRR